MQNHPLPFPSANFRPGIAARSRSITCITRPQMHLMAKRLVVAIVGSDDGSAIEITDISVGDFPLLLNGEPMENNPISCSRFGASVDHPIKLNWSVLRHGCPIKIVFRNVIDVPPGGLVVLPAILGTWLEFPTSPSLN